MKYIFAQVFNNLIESYGYNIVQNLIQKFKDEDPTLEEETIEWYIDRFYEIKSIPQIQRFASRVFKIKDPSNIQQYSWSQLETTVDQSKPSDSHPKLKSHQVQSTDAKIIYDENNLKIYDAPSQEACIQLGQHTFGKSYTFCVSRKGPGNLYSSYRFNGSSFYFVYDSDRSQSDPYHLIVVQISQNGKFTVTPSTNVGDKKMSWDEIVRIQPKLEGLEHLFKFHKFSSQEELELIVTRTTYREFDMLRYNLKVAYISKGKLIGFSSWELLSKELKILYVNMSFNRPIANFFQRENIEGIPTREDFYKSDTVQILEDTLKQQVNRYISRIKSAETFQPNSDGRIAYHIGNIKFEYDGETLKLQKMYKEYNKFGAAKYIHGGNLTAKVYVVVDRENTANTYSVYAHAWQGNGSLKYEYNSEQQVQAVIEALNSTDPYLITATLPDFWKEIVSTKKVFNYTGYNSSAALEKLLTNYLLTDKEIDDKYFKQIIKTFLNTSENGELYFTLTDTDTKDVDEMYKKLTRSKLFNKFIETADQYKNSPVNNFNYKNNTYISIAFKNYKYNWIILTEKSNISQYAVYRRSLHSRIVYRGKTLPRDIFKAVQRNKELPMFISLPVNTNTFIDADGYVEKILSQHKKEKALKSAQKNNKVVTKFMELKKISYSAERQKFMRLNGVIKPIKMRRKTITDDKTYVFISPFDEAYSLISPVTLRNLKLIGEKVGITWQTIIIAPVIQRVAASFFIKGVHKDGATIYYCRKEGNHPSSGRTYILDSRNNFERSVTGIISQIKRNGGVEGI